MTYSALRYAAPDPCLLDLYAPPSPSYPTVVLIHGGGMEAGSRISPSFTDLAAALNSRGIALVSPDYRMFPDARYPDFIRDAAAAVAWCKRELPAYGADSRLYVGGLSAGAYLSMMLCFDPQWLAEVDLTPLDVSGWLHGSAQASAHYTCLRYRGFDPKRVIIDETSPIYHITPDFKSNPMQILVSDNDIPNRKEQNELLVGTLRHNGFDMSKVDFRVLHGNHCSFAHEKDAFGTPVFAGMILEFMREKCGENV
jgi:hypothetical protein